MDQPGNHILLRGNSGGAADRMRELLARTVQDHVADQRSNAGALEDIRQRLEGLERLVKEVREREVPGLAARLDGLPRNLEQAVQRPPPWAESLAEHIELLRTQVTPLAELHAMWPEVSTVVSTVDKDGRLGALQAKLGPVDSRLSAVDSRLGALDGKVADAVAKVVDAAQGEVTAQIGSLEETVLTLAEALLRPQGYPAAAREGTRI